jgi:arabinose-5-phosphate isomerase
VPTIRQAGGGVLDAAHAAIRALREGWDADLVQEWCAVMLGRKGRVVLTGMGKSGLVAQKISATLASTGSPSFFLHPAEALHGDLGMVTQEDAVIALSNSGESEEIVRLLPSLLRLGVPLAAITSKPDSSLGRAAKWCFTYGLPNGEGCPLDLAPMASTTLQLVWGDLLAATLMEARGFTREGFALNHPAGALGAKLMKVGDIMHREWPRVGHSDGLVRVLQAMTQGRMGMTTVMDGDRLAGVVTDGDIRRGLEKAQSTGKNPLELKAADLMSSKPITVTEHTLALEAANLMETRKITFLIVGEGTKPSGILHIHDLLSTKVL